MNGRIYDAKLARFLQADPIIQAPYNTQSLNRYSYVINNPLAYTDPSGFSFFKKIAGIAVAAVGTALCGPTCGAWGYAAIGAVSGAVSASVNGGNILQGALIGAVSAAAFHGIGDAFAGCASCTGDFVGSGMNPFAFSGKVFAHGIVGGSRSVLQGGKFGHGFASAGVTQSFASKIGGISEGVRFSVGRIAASAIVGGTASKLSGGKFANGATTGAFSRLFNDEANHAQKGQSLEDYMQEKFGKLAITDAERGFAEAGDRKAFWTSRMERGDPIATVALGIVRNNSFVGPKYVGGRLANMFTGLKGEALNALGVDLMTAHIDAVDFDFSNKIGIPGLLSPTQAAAYHHEVFTDHQLGTGQFGGTLFNTSPNLMSSIWCAGCDHVGEAIR